MTVTKTLIKINNRLSKTIVGVLALLVFITTINAQNIIPKPVKHIIHGSHFTINQMTSIVIDDQCKQQAEYLNSYLSKSFVTSLEIKSENCIIGNHIKLSIDSTLSTEGYKINIGDNGIDLIGADYGGVFYAVQTLMQLLPADIYSGKPINMKLTKQYIEDYPYMPYRGVMLDVARTFTGKEGVKRYIDNLAYHKINHLHWHLTDDEGWRVEIKSYPKLAEIGGFRGGDSPVQPIYGSWDKKYGGYFTQDEIREIVNYAKIRNIEVIPEFDLPGHSRTVAKVYPEIICGYKVDTSASGDSRADAWCVAKEENYKMLEKIIGELCELFPSRYIHLGGDEVNHSQWKSCPDCQKLMRAKGMKKPEELADYFMTRISKFATKRGKTVCVWDEAVASGKLDKSSVAYGWQGVSECIKATDDGYKTVVMPGSYFYIDMKYSHSEVGHTWAGIVDAKRIYSFGFEKNGFKENNMRNVTGVQAGLFTELLLSQTPDFLDYQSYPKICALAEVGWSGEKFRDWDDFYSRITNYHLDRLTAMGLQYRQFPPEANYSNGEITVAKPFEKAELRYTTDGSEPNYNSMVYNRKIIDHDPGKYKFKAFYAGIGSHSVTPTGKVRFDIEAGSTKIIEVKLPEIVDAIGLWYIRPILFSGLKVNKIEVISPDTTYTIIGKPQNVSQTNQWRFYADQKSMSGVIFITVKNENKYDCDGVFEIEPSQYIEPRVTVSSSLKESAKFPFSAAQDYNFATYSRTSTTCKTGDSITFTFAEHVDAYSICVATGLSYLPRYHILKGHVELSQDGINFLTCGELIAGELTVYPQMKVKAVKLISDIDGNSENAVAIQDLKIIPNKR